MNDSEKKSRSELAPTVIEEVLKAYYSKLVEAPDRARTRALNGFTVASGVIAALVAAGLVKGTGSVPTYLQIAGFATLCLWVVAGGAYLLAVVGWKRKSSPASASNANDAAWDRIDEAKSDLSSVRTATKFAQVASLLGLAATILLIGLALLSNKDLTDATLTVTRAGAGEIARACKRGTAVSNPGRPLRVRLDPGALDGRFVALEFAPGACLKSTTTLMLRATAVRRVVLAGRRAS